MNLHPCIENNYLSVLVKPNSRKTEIIKIKDNVVKIAIAAPAEDNKANIELIKFVSKMLKRKVTIISGLKSKNKLLKINEVKE